MGFNLFDPSTYGIDANKIGTNGPNIDIGKGFQDIGNALGLGSPPASNQQTYNINQSAFQNPLGNVAPQLGATLNNFTNNAYQPIAAASSPYTAAAGSGLGQLGAQYAALAYGQGPSLANAQAQQQGAQNLAATESVLGSARGAGSPAAAQLAAINAQTQGQQQIAQNAIQGRTAEELGALGGMGSTYGALGGLGTTVQGQQNQVGQGNQQLNAQIQSQYLQALAAQNAQQQQGAIAGQQLGSSNQLGFENLQSGNYNAAAGRTTQDVGALLGAIGGAVKPGK